MRSLSCLVPVTSFSSSFVFASIPPPSLYNRRHEVVVSSSFVSSPMSGGWSLIPRRVFPVVTVVTPSLSHRPRSQCHRLRCPPRRRDHCRGHHCRVTLVRVVANVWWMSNRCVLVVATVVASSSFAWYRNRHRVIRRRAIVWVVVMEEAGEDGEDQDQDQEYSRSLGSSRHRVIVRRVVSFAWYRSHRVVHHEIRPACVGCYDGGSR